MERQIVRKAASVSAKRKFRGVHCRRVRSSEEIFQEKRRIGLRKIFQEIGSAEGQSFGTQKASNRRRWPNIVTQKEGDRRPCSYDFHCYQPRIKLSSANAKNGTRQAKRKKWRLEPVSRPCVHPSCDVHHNNTTVGRQQLDDGPSGSICWIGV